MYKNNYPKQKIIFQLYFSENAGSKASAMPAAYCGIT